MLVNQHGLVAGGVLHGSVRTGARGGCVVTLPPAVQAGLAAGFKWSDLGMPGFDAQQPTRVVRPADPSESHMSELLPMPMHQPGSAAIPMDLRRRVSEEARSYLSLQWNLTPWSRLIVEDLQSYCR